MINALKNEIKGLYEQANHMTRGGVGQFLQAIKGFGDKRASRAAAGMAYYTLFSMFPLLIVIVTVGSFFVDGNQAIDKVALVMTNAIPVSQGLVQRNIRRILEIRNSVGLIGLVGFLWSASRAFSMLVDNINYAWPGTKLRSFFEKRLMALGIVGTIIGLLVLLMFTSTILNFIAQFRIPGIEDDSVFDSTLWSLVTGISPLVFSFLFFVSLYRWVPTTKVPWQPAIWSGILVTILWRITSRGFSIYLASGLTRFEFVYGSLSAVVVLLLWIYISSVIILFGAHLCAAFSQSIQTVGPKEP